MLHDNYRHRWPIRAGRLLCRVARQLRIVYAVRNRQAGCRPTREVHKTMPERALRIGFVSTRFAGTDGVSLESAKWSDVLTEAGHTCFYFAGESDRPAERSRVVAEAHFEHPVIRRIASDLFDDMRRLPQTSEQVRDLWRLLKMQLLEFIHDFELDVMIVENALAIPMHVPLGLALARVIEETGIPTIGHHHDFFWERQRFRLNCIPELLLKFIIHDIVIYAISASSLIMNSCISCLLNNPLWNYGCSYDLRMRMLN